MAGLDTSLCCVPLVHMTCTCDVVEVVDSYVGPEHLLAAPPGGLDNFVCCGQISCIWYST
jgi:hypothetical protein